MNIHGLMKTTLLDYPGHVACTIFLGGCNLRCPYCHNGDFVLQSNTLPTMAEDDLFQFLQKRKHVLEGVCISGGEPTLRSDLPSFIKKIKALGYKVKLDTNGTNPKMLQFLVEENLLDYVAMDIKNSWDNYALTTGLNSIALESIQKSVKYLLSNVIPYEFRTTVVRELHKEQDILQVCQGIQGCNAYYLQSFVPSNKQIQSGFTAYTNDELHSLLESIKSYIPNAKIRGQA